MKPAKDEQWKPEVAVKCRRCGEQHEVVYGEHSAPGGATVYFKAVRCGKRIEIIHEEKP